MDRAQESPQVYGSFDDGGELIMPLQLRTLHTLAQFLKEDKTDELEETIMADPVLYGFLENLCKQGALHDIRNPRRKNVVEELNVTTYVGEEADGSGNAGEMDVDDDENDDEDDDEPVEVLVLGDDENPFWEWVFKTGQSTIEKLITPGESLSGESLTRVAEKVAFDESLIALADKILEPFQNGEFTSSNAQHYCEKVSLFWENKNIHKAFCYELEDKPLVFNDLFSFKETYVEEPPKDRIARIKTDPFFSKLFERDDHVAKINGVLIILLGFWMSQALIDKLSKSLYALTKSHSTRIGIQVWVSH